MRNLTILSVLLLSLTLVLGGCAGQEAEQPYQEALDGLLPALFNCPDTELMEGLLAEWSDLLPLSVEEDGTGLYGPGPETEARLIDLYESRFGGYFTPECYQTFVINNVQASLFHLECYNTESQMEMLSYTVEPMSDGMASADSTQEGYYVNVTVRATHGGESEEFQVENVVYFTADGLIGGFVYLDVNGLLDFLRPV